MIALQDHNPVDVVGCYFVSQTGNDAEQHHYNDAVITVASCKSHLAIVSLGSTWSVAVITNSFDL